jgi:hypothetical protein
VDTAETDLRDLTLRLGDALREVVSDLALAAREGRLVDDAIAAERSLEAAITERRSVATREREKLLAQRDGDVGTCSQCGQREFYTSDVVAWKLLVQVLICATCGEVRQRVRMSTLAGLATNDEFRRTGVASNKTPYR